MSREAIAKQQTELLAHLVGEGDAPAGFDRERLEAAREQLARKASRRCQAASDHGRATLLQGRERLGRGEGRGARERRRRLDR